MSIYATISTIRLPQEGMVPVNEKNTKWVSVIAQGVPAHIGRRDQYDDDPYSSFLPPALKKESNLPYRAVVFVKQGSKKGGKNHHPQEYHNPILVLSGKQYEQKRFDEIVHSLLEKLRRQ